MLKLSALERQETYAGSPEPAGRHEEAVLYGDSSPFPYGFDFLSAVRAVVDGCVAMLAAQSSIDQMVKRSVQLEQALKGERWQLEQLQETVRKATGAYAAAPPRIGESAAEVLATTRAIVERERAKLEQAWQAQLTTTERLVDDACASAYQALEQLLLHHVPPQTSLAWRLVADDDGYDALVRLSTRFGLEANFGIAIPQLHAWSRLQRVADLSPSTLRVPRPLGRRAPGLQLVTLDRFVLTEVTVEPERLVLTLRRHVKSGNGYRFEVKSESGDASVRLLDELGQPGYDDHPLVDEDRDVVLRLASAVLDSTFDLALRRQLMIGAALDGHPLSERYEPREVCARILGQYAPIVAEISRRSSSKDELMLRRDVGNGRREALFITRAELRQRILRLPPALRTLFDRFGL